MRIPENKKRVLIHGWNINGEDEISFSEFLAEIEEIKKKINGKEGYVYFELEYYEGDGAWIDDIHFYEITDKLPEDIENEKKKKEEAIRKQEMQDLLQYEKLKAKFEGGK